MSDDHEFILCLTHDVDRVHKSLQGPYYAVKERDLSHLKSLFTSENPYWQFENIMELEEELGVRSTFFFLNEKNLIKEKLPEGSVDPRRWKYYMGYYDVKEPEIVDMTKELDRKGWEIGLHGSYDSYKDLERLNYEKKEIEDIVKHEINGVRQHYLNLDNPKTWKYQQEVGFSYDSSLGSSEEFGFLHGYDVKKPFDDDFLVFPLTIMDSALMDNTSSVSEAWELCYDILKEAKNNSAVMTVLWHQRCFDEKDFPGYAKIYEKIIKTAQEMDAWVGSMGEAFQLCKNKGW